ncbi:MAG: hypothetical protein EXS13_11285 [Planctomycetes bacterium]|nr:hypothetical protein [Planctomycetota bacterium]
MNSFRTRPPRPRHRVGGFTMVEVMMVTAMMATVLTTIGIGLRAGHCSRREMERRAQLTSVVAELLDRMFRIPFGSQGDGTASAAQLDEIFDGDSDLGTASLTSLRAPAGTTGWTFAIAEFPWGGQFEVRVDSDLNGDGDEADANEGREDLLRASIRWNGTLLLESIRCAPWSQA